MGCVTITVAQLFMILLLLISYAIVDIESIHFNTEKECYYIQKYGFPVSAAVFRNFLIQFKALIEVEHRNLEISSNYEAIFAGVQIESHKQNH